MNDINERFVKMAREFHKDHGCIGSESFETCTADICSIARSIILLENVSEEITENTVQPLSSRLQKNVLKHVVSERKYCMCETPEQPWWGDAFTCDRCNRPYRIVVDMGVENTETTPSNRNICAISKHVFVDGVCVQCGTPTVEKLKEVSKNL